MGAGIGFGITKLLAYDASFDEKMDFLKKVFALKYSDGFYEVIQVLDESGNDICSPRLFMAHGSKVSERFSPFNDRDIERINIWRNERQSIDYNMWGELSSVQIFIPHCTFDRPQDVDLPPFGSFNVASAAYGLGIAEYAMEEAEGIDKEIWEGVYNMFNDAYNCDMLMMASD